MTLLLYWCLPMGELRNVSSGYAVLLEPDHLIGRSRRCPLQLIEPYVSSQHAEIRWNGQDWELRDLGSRNGTYLGDELIRPGYPYRLAKGVAIAFGRNDQLWLMTDDAAPQVMAIPFDGGAPLVMADGILGVPSHEDPQASVYAREDGTILLDCAGETVELANGANFWADGRLWRMCVPAFIDTTLGINAPIPPDVRETSLLIRVSASASASGDGNLVEMWLDIAGTMHHLGSRIHNAVLLALAQRRLADAAAGSSPDRCGWMDQAEVADASHVDIARLNVDVYRIRKQFGHLRVRNPAKVIERRPRDKTLRLGIADVRMVHET